MTTTADVKTFAFVLFVLLAVQSYGVFGAVQADRVLYTCTTEVGPLCYAWEETTWAKMLGPDRAAQLEDKLAEAKESWEKDFVERFLSQDEESDMQRALRKAKEAAEDVIDAFDTKE